MSRNARNHRAPPVALVVDDDPAVARLIAMFLEVCGYTALVYTSARQALAEHQTGSAAVLITDASMPDMTGLSFIAAVRERDPEVPAILVSGHTFEDLESPRTIQLSKPFSMQDLAEALRSVVKPPRKLHE